MSTNRRRPWQYSLATLMLVTALAAVVCALAGLVGYALLLGFAPILWVFWATYRLVDQMIGRQQSLKQQAVGSKR